MPKPATLGSEELPGYGLRRRRSFQFDPVPSTAAMPSSKIGVPVIWFEVAA
jgi:hypothetical protein